MTRVSSGTVQHRTPLTRCQRWHKVWFTENLKSNSGKTDEKVRLKKIFR